MLLSKLVGTYVQVTHDMMAKLKVWSKEDAEMFQNHA